MHAFILSVLDIGSSGSGPGFAVFLRNDLGQVTYPLSGLLSEKKASIKKNGDLSRSAECYPWL